MILRFIFAIIATTGLSAYAAAEQKNDSKADSKAEIICDNARFTVLTSRLIRMEWAEDGHFEDRASFTVINRNLPLPTD